MKKVRMELKKNGIFMDLKGQEAQVLLNSHFLLDESLNDTAPKESGLGPSLFNFFDPKKDHTAKS